MGDLATDRVYDERGERTELIVAADVGAVAVEVSRGRVGRFGVERRCSPRDVVAGPVGVALATAEDVLLDAGDGEGFRPLEFGPALAVGAGERVVAAGPGGRVARRGDGEWRDLGSLPAVRAIDGDLIAAESGVHRVADGLPSAGLSDARDVSAVGTPLAATADGLYALGNGWMELLAGGFRAVGEAPDGSVAHAAGERFHERVDGEWRAADVPADAPVADVTYGTCPYAITADGTLLAEPGGWEAHALGLEGAVGIARRPP